MEIVLAALVAAGVAAAVVLLTQRSRSSGHAVAAARPGPAPATSREEERAAVRPRGAAGDGAAATGVQPAAMAGDAEMELRERRAEVARIEERLLRKEEALGLRLSEVTRKEQSVDDRARNLDREVERLKAAKQEQIRELERVAGLSVGQAKQILLRELEDELHHDSATLIRRAEEQALRDADRRARSILSACMQRLASGHAAETTVSLVTLPSDDLKGRIIGREGRNIRSLETLTGIDFIIDDTPGAVILSGFDGVRRQIARLTLEKLLQDGRIHPARIEEAYYQAKSEIDQHIVEVGEQAVYEANVGPLHPELVKLLGRLHYRTSYGQNVLAHSIECAHLAAMIADELGASSKTARRAALLHDIGKSVSHEVEGPHALVGGEIARRYKEPEAVAHAMEAHHNEVEMQTVEAVIVQVADSLSGARPGARGESLEQYVKRLRDLEEIATRHGGVEKVYAMQAGREIRVIVRPEDVDDDEATVLSRKIARDVEKELEYPGQIKVTVIRESRAVDYAK
jgi:ribonuclease Y